MNRFLLVFFVTVVFSYAVYSEGEKETTPTGYSEGEVVYVEGTVTINDDDAEFGMGVTPGAVVKTDRGSLCDIVFGNKNVMRVYENTIVTVDVSRGTARIDEGSLGAVFRKLSSALTEDGSRFHVTTNSVAGGVRGTSFFVKVENPDSTYLCTCFGKMRLQDRAGENERNVEAYHHKAYRFILEEDGVRTESAGLAYHDDDSMEAIAAVIDEKILWRGTAY